MATLLIVKVWHLHYYLYWFPPPVQKQVHLTHTKKSKILMYWNKLNIVPNISRFLWIVFIIFVHAITIWCITYACILYIITYAHWIAKAVTTTTPCIHHTSHCKTLLISWSRINFLRLYLYRLVQLSKRHKTSSIASTCLKFVTNRFARPLVTSFWPYEAFFFFVKSRIKEYILHEIDLLLPRVGANALLGNWLARQKQY